MEAELKIKSFMLSGDRIFERLEAVLQTMKALPKSISIGHPSHNSYYIVVSYVVCDTDFRLVNYATSFYAWPVETEACDRILNSVIGVVDTEPASCACVYNDFEGKVNVLTVHKKNPPSTMWDHLRD